MPELPEVETIRRLLETQLLNKQITNIDIIYSKMIYGNYDDFYKIEGQSITAIKRKGKFLIINFSNHYVLISHLRMEGKYYLYDECEPSSKYARIVFHLNDEKKLCYDDSRKFGVMKVIKEENLEKEPWLMSLGPEPMDIKDIHPLYNKAQKIHKPIKILLMDQSFIAGLGNIYADETLFACKIHPETPSYLISLEEWNNIIKQAERILLNAIKEGGSTIRSYHAAREIDGRFQEKLLVYGQKDSFCPHCQCQFDKIVVGGRGTTYCPHCQKNKTKKAIVGLTGPIGCGKSTALKILKSLGADTISSDDIVHRLYQDKKVQKRLEKILHVSLFDEKGDFSKSKLRYQLAKNPLNKKNIEDYIFPLVRRQLIDFIRQSKKAIIVLEVPLLFESKFDYLCDKIIAIKVSNKNQYDNLYKRGQQNIEEMIKMNYEGEHYPFIDKLDCYIDSHNDKKMLFRALKSFYDELINK